MHAQGLVWLGINIGCQLINLFLDFGILIFKAYSESWHRKLTFSGLKKPDVMPICSKVTILVHIHTSMSH